MRELHHLANFDALTCLPNRTLFNDKLAHAMAADDAPPFALLFIDLDRFKIVNDSLGHAAGDQLLQEVTRRDIVVVTVNCIIAPVFIAAALRNSAPQRLCG